MPKDLGIHETLELHEILTFKNTCLTKSASMSALAQDEFLKDLLVQDTTQSKQQITQLQEFMPKTIGGAQSE